MISRLEKRPKTAIVKASTATFEFISGGEGVALLEIGVGMHPA
jgi:hypothetical protein